MRRESGQYSLLVEFARGSIYERMKAFMEALKARKHGFAACFAILAQGIGVFVERMRMGFPVCLIRCLFGHWTFFYFLRLSVNGTDFFARFGNTFGIVFRVPNRSE